MDTSTILSILALVAAIIIGIIQVKLSKKQIEISKEQLLIKKDQEQINAVINSGNIGNHIISGSTFHEPVIGNHF